MATVVNYHILKNAIVLNFNGRVINVDRDSELGTNVLDKIRKNELSSIPELVTYEAKLKRLANEVFVIEDGMIYSYGEPVPNYIADRILEFMNDNLPFMYLINFWNNLKSNPSKNSRNQLFAFLEKNNFPITADGHFIAYKKVKDDYFDDHSGSMDNSPGKIVKMNREDVVDDPNQSCSAGLHIAPYDYAKTYKPDGKLIELKVNPRDVVSVPTSYEHQKARVCEYYVVCDAGNAGINEPIVTGEKYVVPKETIKPESKFDTMNPAVQEQVKPDETNLLDKSEIEDVEKAVKSKEPIVIKIVTLGNYKYNIMTLTAKEYLVITKKSHLMPRKKSKWAKSFTDMWGDDISKIDRIYNSVTGYYEYIITLVNDSMFYSTFAGMK